MEMAKIKSLLTVAKEYGEKTKPKKRKGKRRMPRSRAKLAFKAYRKRHSRKAVRHYVKHKRTHYRKHKRHGISAARRAQLLKNLAKARAARSKGAKRKHYAKKATYKRVIPAQKQGGFFAGIKSLFGGGRKAPVRKETIVPRRAPSRASWGQSSVYATGPVHQTRPKGHRYSMPADKKRVAMKPGKRRTKWGTEYYEYRVNRTDKNPRERY